MPQKRERQLPGANRPLSHALTGGRPQRNTNTVMIAQGVQARNSSAVEWGVRCLVVVAAGRELGRERFLPNRDFEERQLPAIRAPHEGLSCLKQLAALAAL